MVFSNLIEIVSNLSDRKVCIDFLLKERWQGHPKCVFCNSERVFRLKSLYGYHKCNDCNKMFSATKGTIFEKSPIPLQKWFLAMYLFSAHKKGISSCQLARDLNITQKSSWFMLHRIRYAFKEKHIEQMSGVIQIDETYVGGKNKNRISNKKIANSQGRSLKDKVPVLGMVQADGRVFMQVVEDTKGATLNPIIERMVAPGSIVVTDEYPSYNNISEKYKHVVINHSEQEFVRGAFDTNKAENMWSVLKRGVYGIYHKVDRRHLNKYCDEFGFRLNTKKMNDGERFEHAMQTVNCRITYDQLKIKKVSLTQEIQQP
jgi:transposase-like protein